MSKGVRHTESRYTGHSKESLSFAYFLCNATFKVSFEAALIQKIVGCKVFLFVVNIHVQ